MLFKLLKYDFKSMLRTFLPLWGIVLFLSFGNYIIPATDPFEGSSAIAVLVIGALLVAIFTITVVLVLQRFYNGLLKDEGYLMFTLPVKAWHLVLSKYITALSIVLLSTVVGSLAIFLLSTKGLLSQSIWDRLLSSLDSDAYQLMILAGITSLVALMENIARVYLSMAIGHLFFKHRIAFSIAAFIAINTISTQVQELIIRDQLFQSFTGFTSWADTHQMLIQAGTYQSLLLLLFLTALYLVLTQYILSKRLNLE